MGWRRLSMVLAMLGCVRASMAIAEPLEIPWRDPSAWSSDGMWKIEAREDGIEFLKDEKPAHNSMCWLRLPSPLARGDRLQIAYQLEKPFKHVDLFLGHECGQPRYGEEVPEFAEVISLGGIPETDMRLRTHIITGEGTIDTLGFLVWGWREDRNTWMRVGRLEAARAARPGEWIAWPVPAELHDRPIPSRHPLQDFFPFGVYISFGDCSAAAMREGKGIWEWLDEALGDLAARGMNFTSIVNFSQANLDKLVELHRKHGLRMNPQAGEHDLRHNQHEAALRSLKRAVARFRASGVIAGWGAGEEFPPAQVPQLDLAHEIVHAVDPQNTLVTIHNRVQAFQVLNGSAADVRIAFRDVYPFFSEPRAGPTTFEASMNYYEDEIDKCKQWLPHGASLWVMPQAQGEHGYIRTPTPAEVKLEAWSAIAHGAQGLAYFVYHSAGEPGRLKFDGLRALDGSPTDRLVALTELAQVLVPLGPLIARWSMFRMTAETDVRSLRAYLFRSEGKRYTVVYNRNVKEATKGRVRLPFATGETVADLVNTARIPTQVGDDRTIFSVNLPAGEGTIIFLGPDPRNLTSRS